MQLIFGHILNETYALKITTHGKVILFLRAVLLKYENESVQSLNSKKRVLDSLKSTS